MKAFALAGSVLFSVPPQASIPSADKIFESALQNHERGLLEQAERGYRECLKVNPSYVSAYINLGNLLSSKGKSVEAETEYKTAIRLNPQSYDATYNLGALYLSMARYDDALKYFEKTVELNRRHKSAWLNMATIYMRYYRTKAELGLWQSARDSLMRAAEIDREYPHIYYNFGMLHEMKNEYGIARQYYREALRLYSEKSPYYQKTIQRMQYLDTVLR